MADVKTNQLLFSRKIRSAAPASHGTCLYARDAEVPIAEISYSVVPVCSIYVELSSTIKYIVYYTDREP